MWFLGEVQGLLEEFFGVYADEFHFLKVLDEGEGFVEVLVERGVFVE